MLRTMLFASVFFTLSASASAFAESGTCFQLSPDGKSWSRTPELMCIEETAANQRHTIRLKTGLMDGEEVITLRFDLVHRVRCVDCNQDEFALANPSNSVLNALAIKFDGKRDVKTGEESGTVMVGSTKFHYRRTPSAQPPAPPPIKK